MYNFIMFIILLTLNEVSLYPSTYFHIHSPLSGTLLLKTSTYYKPMLLPPHMRRQTKTYTDL